MSAHEKLISYFGGSLELVSLDGWGTHWIFSFPEYRQTDGFPGTDVYLRLPKLVGKTCPLDTVVADDLQGTNLEGIEV